MDETDSQGWRSPLKAISDFSKGDPKGNTETGLNLHELLAVLALGNPIGNSRNHLEEGVGTNDVAFRLCMATMRFICGCFTANPSCVLKPTCNCRLLCVDQH